ncbi:DUF6786 family protein [Dyadobacter sp. CY323]|uniref:DUF6786 family protein n=1 Tax=Dyadobacter sp. CY323 TaxID=2907302 RepID=UPI001F366395|nr:DUF6786 family protein [Dyadobacter sp. CY323]MCE6988238.1 hypothetical protein [Dyadobacter sp. CY323]
MKRLYPFIFIIGLTIGGCQNSNKSDQNTLEDTTAVSEGTFGYDLAFLKKHKDITVLTSPDDSDSKAIIIAGYQGRVMTSTANGNAGNSYGWINYDLIESGKLQPHINAFGGEERFWLSPEGGQFSVYFKKGKKFEFENWQTPALIDTVAFKVVESDSSSVSFQMNAMIENYTGTVFVMEINRKIMMLGKSAILGSLDLNSIGECKVVAYESVNFIVNKDAEWKPETGMLGIWLLGMFKPSDKTVIVAPFSKKLSEKPLITDDYFGKIPGDRFIIKDSVAFLKADGKFRSKIGIAPRSARNVAGSYDAEKGILTIIQYDLEPESKYLKSTWEIHKDPYNGDALNAYNDGKLADGTQMGPFYELESNSPAKPLKEGEKVTHRQRTYHFEGEKSALNAIAQKTLGVSIDQIGEIFK